METRYPSLARVLAHSMFFFFFAQNENVVQKLHLDYQLKTLKWIIDKKADVYWDPKMSLFWIVKKINSKKERKKKDRRFNIHGISRSWTKVAVAIIDLEGLEAHWSQHLESISNDVQNKIDKNYIKKNTIK